MRFNYRTKNRNPIAPLSDAKGPNHCLKMPGITMCEQQLHEKGEMMSRDGKPVPLRGASQVLAVGTDFSRIMPC